MSSQKRPAAKASITSGPEGLAPHKDQHNQDCLRQANQHGRGRVQNAEIDSGPKG